MSNQNELFKKLISHCKEYGFICGKSKKVPLYKFLKNALIRKYGKDWYKKLDEIAKII